MKRWSAREQLGAQMVDDFNQNTYVWETPDGRETSAAAHVSLCALFGQSET